MFFEDFVVGRRYESPVGRTVTEFDNILFTLLTNNVNQIHFNLDYTRRRLGWEPFRGRLVVNGLLTLAIGVGLTTSFTTEVGGIMLGLEDVRFLHPVFPGDTLYAEAEVVEKRPSRSRPGYGIVKLRTTVKNQDGARVAEFVRVIMVPMRGASGQA